MSVATMRSSRGKSPGELLDSLSTSFRYQDLRELGDRRGVALTWRSGWSENLSVTLAMTADDDAEHMAKIRMRRVGDGQGPWRLGNAGDEPRGRPWTGFHVNRALTMLCPGPDAVDDLITLTLREHAGPYLDPAALAEARASFRAQARTFFSTADIPEGMRTLLMAATDFGVRDGVHNDMPSLWRECGRRVWDVETLAVTHPFVAVAALRNEGFRSVVRHGGTCEEALALTWPGLTRGHMRRLRTAPIPGKGEQTFLTPGMALGLCAAVPADWLPEGGGWRPFNSISAVREGLNATVRREGGARLFASVAGDWHGFLCRLKPGVRKGSWDSDDSWTRAIAREAGLLGDAPWQAATTLVQPLLSHEGLRRRLLSDALAGGGYTLEAFRIAYELVYGDKALPAVMEVSREWHKRQDAIQAAIAGIGDDIRWPALFKPFRHLGMVALPVTDALSLHEEGAPGPDRRGVPGMDHCVATRLPLLLAGSSHVVSIRRELPDGGYERLSTLEVSVAGGAWREVEHQAHRNFLPGVDAQVMAFRLRDAFKEGSLGIPRCFFRREDVTEGGDVVFRMAGYDWRSARHVEGALRAWEASLPRWMRGLSPAQTYDALVARGLLETDWPDSMGVQDENGIRLAFDGGR